MLAWLKRLRADKRAEQARTLRLAGQLKAAEVAANEALAWHPSHAVGLHELALALQAEARYEEALAIWGRFLALEPTHVEALFKKGNALLRLQRPQEALSVYERVLSLRPDFPDAHYNCGVALQQLKRLDQAIQCFDEAVALKPDDAEAFNGRGNALLALRRLQEALGSYEAALAVQPTFADALYNRAVVLQELKRPAKAALAYARLLEVSPEYPFAKGRCLHAQMLSCDWSSFERLKQELAADMRGGRPVAEPFSYLGVADLDSEARRCAEIYAAYSWGSLQPAAYAQSWQGAEKIRIGYVSGEFRQQATAVLITQLLEQHDRERFEIYAFDNGWDDGSTLRRRIKACVHMVDISKMNDIDAAKEISRLGIDILVDLNGYFGFCRPGVFRLKPAPLQVNYLGFPGTLGAASTDYILADEHVIPLDARPHYVEKVVYLPDSYQVNDARRGEVQGGMTRSEAGLPEQGFVFCCFNNNFKITPAVFDVWMRILEAVEGSVLWLLEDNAAVSANLQREAKSRGIRPERLIFAKRVAIDQHLSRQRLADLFLDTLPCNAHTTASDALWAGLPVLTCTGQTFAGRVATSLLHAIGLPQLAVDSLQAYEALAIELAAPPHGQLQEIKATLARNRLTQPLFDTARFCGHIEAAYAEMWRRHRSGLAPEGFDVRDLPGQ